MILLLLCTSQFNIKGMMYVTWNMFIFFISLILNSLQIICPMPINNICHQNYWYLNHYLYFYYKCFISKLISLDLILFMNKFTKTQSVSYLWCQMFWDCLSCIVFYAEMCLLSFQVRLCVNWRNKGNSIVSSIQQWWHDDHYITAYPFHNKHTWREGKSCLCWVQVWLMFYLVLWCQQFDVIFDHVKTITELIMHIIQQQ